MTEERRQTGQDGPLRISSLIDRVLTRQNLQHRIKLHRVFEFWNEVVGREIAGRAQPSLIRGSVLWVDVCDSVWMQQLHLQKMLLLDMLNQRLAEDKLADIRFKLDSALDQPDLPPAPAAVKKKKNPPSEKEKLDFDRLISSIRNEEVRAAVKSLWHKLHSID